MVEYWECDDDGKTPDSAKISEQAFECAKESFYRWQEKGGMEDIMSCMREAWLNADKEVSEHE